MSDFFNSVNLGFGNTKIKPSSDGFHVTDFTQTLKDQHIQTSCDVNGLGDISGLHTTVKDRATGQKCKLTVTPLGDIKVGF